MQVQYRYNPEWLHPGNHQEVLIHEYARTGNVAGVTEELKKGVKVNLKDERGFTPLACAIRSGDIEMVRVLIGWQADVKYEREHGYDALVDAMFSDNLTLPLIALLIENGAALNTVTQYGESAFSVASNKGLFDVVKLLREANANDSVLNWTPLMNAIVFGSLSDCEALIQGGADLNARDSWERTPWLLSLQVGNVEKAKLLLDAGSDRNARGRCGKVPFEYAIENNHLDVLRWLLANGFDPAMVNDFNEAPLLGAVRADSLESVAILLHGGASIFQKVRDDEMAIHHATSVEMVRLLVEAGADLNEINDEARAKLTNIPNDEVLNVLESEFRSNRYRRFGNSNPQRMNFSFWMDMIRSGSSAYRARSKFEIACEEPVWSFKRFGKSITELPDGRIVEIAGEHEDWYDSDFCIYNDVVVHAGDGTFDVFGYPETVFPPTDFHSATLIGNHIYIIGNLGYSENRVSGETPVFRLNCETFEIEKLVTSGAKPGWISEHKAKCSDGRNISITGGKIWIKEDDKVTLKDNEGTFVLNSESLTWSDSGLS